MKIQLSGGLEVCFCPVTNWARYVPHKRSFGTLARAHREHLAGRGVTAHFLATVHLHQVEQPYSINLSIRSGLSSNCDL